MGKREATWGPVSGKSRENGRVEVGKRAATWAPMNSKFREKGSV